MFSIASILAGLPWRLIAVGALAAALFVGGCQFGEGRVTAQWDAEKLATAEVVAKQADHVAAVNAQESTINQEISNEFQKAKSAIATDGRDLLARVPQRVRVDAASRDSIMPGISIVAARVAAAASDPVPAAEQPASNATCERLAEDAAQTTLMVVEFQRWYRLQSASAKLITP